MFIPRGVKRKYSNAIYSPEAIKHAKPISFAEPHNASPLVGEFTSNQLEQAATDNEDKQKENKDEQSNQITEVTASEHESSVPVVPNDPDVEQSDDEDQEPIKQASIEQRFPLNDEPLCVVCGKYGEYISDTTERDVCSMECKLKDIANYARNPAKDPICQGIAYPQYSIATNVHAKLTAYHDSPEVSMLHPKAIEAMRSAHDITVEGQNVPRPITTFESCQLDATLLENIRSAGFKKPTPVQMQALSVALAGRDMLVSAPTSSGKTVSYLVPMITHCLSLAKMYGNAHHSGPLGLIIAPTRELCAQIESVAKQLAAGLPHMKTALLIGGNPIPNQVYRLKQGVQILVATPGRMIELLNHHKSVLKLENIKMMIMDEVDIMFKMGFNEQIARILNSLVDPGIRQTCFYSATWESEEVMRRACRKHLRNSITVQVGRTKAQPNKHVKQTIMWVEDQSKSKQLMSILRDPKYYEPPILIFVDSKLATELLAQAIRNKCGFNVLAMHGDLSQPERDEVLQQVRQSTCDIVVATGVLARGIDLQNVRMVINYDMANTVDEYIHQVGRAMVTSAKGAHGTKQHTRKQGWAITFINNVSLKKRKGKKKMVERSFHEQRFSRVFHFLKQEHRYLFRGLFQTLMQEYQGEVTPLPLQLKSIM
jgi:ATP-dependent RNA helicase DDX59